MSDEYIAPECKWDFAATLRDNILRDVECFGEVEKCPQQMSFAFSGWEHSQIDEWCAEHNVTIIARYDGRIVICRATGERLRFHGITVGDAREIARQQREAQLIRAEVEAMDWPEII